MPSGLVPTFLASAKTSRANSGFSKSTINASNFCCRIRESVVSGSLERSIAMPELDKTLPSMSAAESSPDTNNACRFINQLDGSLPIKASEAPQGAMSFGRLHCRNLRQLWPPSSPSRQWHHQLPLAQRYLLHRFRPAVALLRAAFPQLAAASRSACQVGRISPAFAAGPHGYPSYIPLLEI